MFKLGEEIKTSSGKALVLDIKKNYLILFIPGEGKFIKANDYKKLATHVFWNGGEYYKSFDELLKDLAVEKWQQQKRIKDKEISR